MLHQVGVQRQDHERQVAVNDADIGRRGRVEDLQRLVDQPDLDQEIVDQAVVLEDADPGVDADQERSPRGQHDQHQSDVARRRRQPRNGVGHRVTDQQGQDRRHRRDPQRTAEGFDIQRVGHQGHVVAQVELHRDRVLHVLEDRRVRRRTGLVAHREGDAQHDQERDGEEQQHPQVRQCDHAPALARKQPGQCLSKAPVHEVSTTPSLSPQDTQTSSPQVMPSLAQRSWLAKLAIIL